MYKLKRSRAAKVICFLLACFFMFTVMLSAVFAVYLYNTRGADALSDDVFNGVYTYLSHLEVNRLVSSGLIGDVIYGDGDGFLNNHRQFTEGRTNFAFTVTDENGKVLFRNFQPEATLPGYSAEEVFYVYDDDSMDYSYSGLSESASIAAQNNETDYPEGATEITAAPEITLPDVMDETTAAPDEETVTERQVSEPQLNEDSSAVDNENPLVGENEQVYIVDDRDEGLDSIFMFIYPEREFRNEIYTYCYDLYKTEYEPVEAMYYRNGRYEVYHQTDFAVSENGYVYFIGTEREYSTSYSPPEVVKTVTYNVTAAPDASLKVKDIVYYASLFEDTARFYTRHFAAITACLVLAAVIFASLSFIFAGYVRDEEKPVARGVHRLPADILLLALAVSVIVFIVMLVDVLFYNGYYYSYFDWDNLILPPALVLIYVCLYILAVKIKTRTVLSSCVSIRLIKWIAELIKQASDSLNVLWKLGIIYVITGIISVFVIYVTNHSRAAELAIYVVFKILELIPLVLVAINLHTLQSGARDISRGSLKNVSNRFLFGEFRKNADYLNSINSGINMAVEERLKSESTKTELITNVSHDLKTPLTSIVNYIDLLKKEELNNPKAREYVEVIDRQSQRLKKLTTDIVDASKAAAGSLEIKMENTDLSVLLGQVKGEYSERLAEKSLTLIDSSPDHPVTVYADGRLLWRVFDNLMNNICKYSLENTRVYLALTEKDGKAQVVFRNISAEELNVDANSLTERFVRGDSSRGTEGSGLGLYIAKSLTENMGGTFGISIDGDLFKATVGFNVI